MSILFISALTAAVLTAGRLPFEPIYTSHVIAVRYSTPGSTLDDTNNMNQHANLNTNTKSKMMNDSIMLDAKRLCALVQLSPNASAIEQQLCDIMSIVMNSHDDFEMGDNISYTSVDRPTNALNNEGHDQLYEQLNYATKFLNTTTVEPGPEFQR